MNRTKSTRPRLEKLDWRGKTTKLEEIAKMRLSILPLNGSTIIDTEHIIPVTDPLILEFLVSLYI